MKGPPGAVLHAELRRTRKYASWTQLVIPANNAERQRSTIVNLKKTAAGTVLGGAMLVAAGAGLAHAVPSAPQAVTGDGRVDVTVTAGTEQIGIIPNVSLSNAVALATAVCPTAGIDLPALTNLDNAGTPLAQSCNGITGLAFSFSQNANAGAQGGNGQGGSDQAGNSQYAPGHNKAPGATSPSATASTPPGQQGQQTR